MSQVLLKLHNVSVNFESKKVLRKVSFDLQKGEVVCVIGESGCGKTTILNTIQGLLNLDAGKILFNGVKVLEPKDVLVPGQEGISTVFQDFQVQEHLTVQRNLFHQVNHLSPSRQKKIVSLSLRTCRLFEIRNKFPSKISGGQRQKLALAKSLITDPELILLDEPFSHLDNISKNSFQEIISDLKNEGMSFIYVTHDVEDAIQYSDRVIVLKDGKVERNVLSGDLYQNLNSVFIARLFNMNNIFTGAALNKAFGFDLEEFSYYNLPQAAIKYSEQKGVKFTCTRCANLGRYYEFVLSEYDIHITLISPSNPVFIKEIVYVQVNSSLIHPLT